MSASQWKTLSIYDQLELIDDVKVKKLKLATGAKKYGIGYSTAAKILKKEDDHRSSMQMNGNTIRKQKCQSMHKDVNEALKQWFTQACAHGATVTDHIIRQKASQLAVNLEVDFELSNGWKQANNVSFKKFHGESSADHGSANEWVTNVLPQLFCGYDPKDVWNCDETGLFYKAMPSGSLWFAGDEQSNGTKVPKDRLNENDQVSPPLGMEQTDFDEFISFDDCIQCYGELTDTDITRGIKSDDQDFDEDDDAESVSSEVSESDKLVWNSLAALNALETLTAYFEAKSSNPDGVLKMIYRLYESVHDVNKQISVQSKMTDIFKKKVIFDQIICENWLKRYFCLFLCFLCL